VLEGAKDLPYPVDHQGPENFNLEVDPGINQNPVEGDIEIIAARGVAEGPGNINKPFAKIMLLATGLLIVGTICVSQSEAIAGQLKYYLFDNNDADYSS
jgi:hypothetical protein